MGHVPRKIRIHVDLLEHGRYVHECIVLSRSLTWLLSHRRAFHLLLPRNLHGSFRSLNLQVPVLGECRHVRYIAYCLLRVCLQDWHKVVCELIRCSLIRPVASCSSIASTPPWPKSPPSRCNNKASTCPESHSPNCLEPLSRIRLTLRPNTVTSC